MQCNCTEGYTLVLFISGETVLEPLKSQSLWRCPGEGLLTVLHEIDWYSLSQCMPEEHTFECICGVRRRMPHAVYIAMVADLRVAHKGPGSSSMEHCLYQN